MKCLSLLSFSLSDKTLRFLSSVLALSLSSPSRERSWFRYGYSPQIEPLRSPPYAHSIATVKRLSLFHNAFAMALSDESQQLQNPPMALDALFCEEDDFDEALADDSDVMESILPPVLLENDLFWEDDELTSLIGKEEAQISDLSSDASVAKARR